MFTSKEIFFEAFRQSAQQPIDSVAYWLGLLAGLEISEQRVRDLNYPDKGNPFWDSKEKTENWFLGKVEGHRLWRANIRLFRAQTQKHEKVGELNGS